MKNTNGTSQSSQPIGAGEQSASVCAFCSAALPESVVYCCTSCEISLMQDPNYLMCGEVNDG